MAATKSFELESTFIVIEPNLSAIPVDVTPTIFEDLNKRFDNFRGRWLVSCFTFNKDWTTWEIHPNGDEIVYLLSGEVEFILEQAGTRNSLRLSKAGSYVIVPKGTWHTAKTNVSTAMLFVTSGEGTDNRPL